jgi:hypothetical protein
MHSPQRFEFKNGLCLLAFPKVLKHTTECGEAALEQDIQQQKAA